MPEKIKRVRRRRKIKSFADLGDFSQKFAPRQLALLIGGVVVAAALVFIALNYGAKTYHDWRESQLIKRAGEMLKQDQFDGATRLAQQALDLNRDSVPAYQILAEATENQNKIETVAWRTQIARLQPNKLESHLNLASAALRFGELDTARKALEQISPNDRDKAAYHVVAGWLARAQGDEVGQQEHFAAALKQEPNNELYQFNLAVLQIKSGDKEKIDHARQTLERLTKSPPFRTGAVRALLNDAIDRGDLSAADGLAQDLQMSPQVTFGDYLLCLNLYRKLDEKKFNALLDKVKPVAARQPNDLALLMNWMTDNALAADVLKWMEKLPSGLTTNAPPAIAIAEAFATVKNWSRLKRWTRGNSWGGSEYLRLAYQAYASRQMRGPGTDAEFDSLWRAADRAASDEAHREIELARLAMKWNLPSEAEQLWLRVARNAPMRREALDALTKIYRSNNDLVNLYRTFQRLHETSPGEPGVAASYARLALLLEQNTKEAQDLAKQAYDRASDDTNCAVTYAFALYAAGRTPEAIEVLKKAPPEQLHESHSAVYVALICADENMEDVARDYIDTARRGPVFPEEKKLLEEATAKIAPLAPPVPSPSPSLTPRAHPSPARSTSPRSPNEAPSPASAPPDSASPRPTPP